MAGFHLDLTTIQAKARKGKPEGKSRLQNSRFLFFSKSVKKSVKRAVRVSLSVFSLVPDLLFDYSRVLEYAKIWTVLQSKGRVMCEMKKERF